MLEHLIDEAGILLRRDAVVAGVDDIALLRLTRNGELARIRHGVYCQAERWREADGVQRHLILSRGVMRLYPDEVALSHTSAAIAQGAPAWGLDLSEVHITDLDRTGQRRRARVRHHRGSCRVGDLTRLEGHWITSPARTALDVAGLISRDAAVCVLDHFLFRGLVTTDELTQGLQARIDWPAHFAATVAVGLARTGAESVGETRLRLLLGDLGFRDMVLQQPFYDGSHQPFAYGDIVLPDLGILLEFDGREKYLRWRRPGESLADCILREKAREDRIREVTGLRVLRVTWADLESPERLRHRILRLAARAA